MTTIINAVASTGLTQTADGSGIIKLQSNGSTTNALAWARWVGNPVSFVGSAYNISSVTRTATGTYTVAFTNATSDGNYNVYVTGYGSDGNSNNSVNNTTTTTSSFVVYTAANSSGSVAVDKAQASVIVFGN